jgi:hypothetical protein
MIKQSLLCAFLLGATAPAAAQEIEVGRANWGKLPALELAGPQLAHADLVTFVERLLVNKHCSFKGNTARRFDITVPYAVLLEPSGKVSRVLVAETNCAPLETMVGKTAIALADAGAIKSAPAGEARWYASEVNFALE